jgi:hypothetical protein
MSNAVYVAWRAGGDADGAWGVVGKLEQDAGGAYRYVYTEGARTLPGFRPFPGMDDLEQIYESNQLFPIFANRLLSKSRPEYEAYLTWGGFDPASRPDPLTILAVTEGITQTDSLEVFPCPAPDSDSRYSSTFFLHGLRHAGPDALERASRLTAGQALDVELDDDNPRDPKAVAIVVDGEGRRCRIGYVPRYLARDVRTLMASYPATELNLVVERVNVRAPIQMRVLCRMRSSWPDDFQPCTGDEFQPIVSSQPVA